MQMNGVNLLRIHSTGPYAYALTLLDTLFTREEQHPCLLFKLSKSEKPGLDSVRVEILLVSYYYIMCELLSQGQFAVRKPPIIIVTIISFYCSLP